MLEKTKSGISSIIGISIQMTKVYENGNHKLWTVGYWNETGTIEQEALGPHRSPEQH